MDIEAQTARPGVSSIEAAPGGIGCNACPWRRRCLSATVTATAER